MRTACNSDRNMSSPVSGQQKRVMLWAIPRSVSSAMCRAMMNSGKTTQIVFEPYGKAYYLGPERVSSRYQYIKPDPKHSFFNCKRRLELPYADNELVFAKDMPYFLGPDRLKADWIPDGYTHTFITRHPRRAVTSMFKVIAQQLPAWRDFDSQECGYAEQLEMLRLLPNLGHKVVVLDADDLLENPEGILRAYCREVGLEHCDSMINWEPLSEDDFQRTFFNGFESEWHTNMKTSAHLSRRPKESEEHGGDVVMGDQGTRDAIEEAMTSNMARYDHMHEQRLVA